MKCCQCGSEPTLHSDEHDPSYCPEAEYKWNLEAGNLTIPGVPSSFFRGYCGKCCAQFCGSEIRKIGRYSCSPTVHMSATLQLVGLIEDRKWSRIQIAYSTRICHAIRTANQHLTIKESLPEELGDQLFSYAIYMGEKHLCLSDMIDDPRL